MANQHTRDEAYFELRLFLEETCCNLCRFQHVNEEKIAPESVRIDQEVYLGIPGAFADIVGFRGDLLDCQVDDLLTHDQHAEEPTLAYLLSRFVHAEAAGAGLPFPEPVGVFRSVRKPTYEELLDGRIAEAVAKKGKGKAEDLFKAEDVWTVE